MHQQVLKDLHDKDQLKTFETTWLNSLTLLMPRNTAQTQLILSTVTHSSYILIAKT